MSLFQVREWWTAKGEQDEEYTPGALVVGNVDNDASGHVKIVTGSLNGVLRVYCPTQSDFRIEHLLLEENLQRPILQLELGYFIPNQRILALAILQPRRLGVYVVEGMGGSGLAASYFKITLRYEHLLGIDGEHFTAYNFIYGPFGAASSGGTTGRSERDHLCVQSLDGRLQFFEQDRFAFLQPLNNNFLPGALCYAPGMDAVIASTSDLQLECYRYQVLASASLKQKRNALDDDVKDDHQQDSSSFSTQVHCDWKLNIGEVIVDVRVARCSYQETPASFDILVLGEFTLFGIKPQGEIYLQKRLGFHPSAFCPYRRWASPTERGAAAGAAGLDNLLISSHTKLWNVFKDKTLIWSACSSTVPVALIVAEFGSVDGMIVSLDSDGSLRVNYMGTDPPSSTVVAPDTKEMNYEEMDEEHRQLLNVIRRSQGERRTEPKDRVLIRAQVPAMLDALPDRSDEFHRGGANQSEPAVKNTQLSMRVYVTYTGATRVSNVTLSVSTPENVVASDSSFVIGNIDGKASTPLIIPVILRPSAEAMPMSLSVTISASYTLETGQPRVSQCVVKLPMCMVCRLVPPVKSSTFKFTLETNQEPLELASLFEDMLHQPSCTPEWAKQVVAGGSTTNVLSFQYYNGVDATILVSKNAGRYRIQSNELEALWMVSHDLVARLRAYFDGREQDSDAKGDGDYKVGESGSTSSAQSVLEVFYQEPLPLADFFGAIDAHFALRKEKLELAAQLNDRAHQFRVIQKRLLVRYKDRSPAAVNFLDVLLHGTYDQLISLSHAMEAVEAKLKRAANRLSCCVSLILMLIKFRFHLSDEDARILEAYLSPVVNESADSGAVEQGWEERADCAMTELLRTVLAKQPQNKDGTAAASVAATSELQMQEDTKRLKKHITIVCDRLGKGASLSGNGASVSSSASTQPVSEAKGD
ncbi:hypothetical protein BBJ29_002636 [Phytophthora kernoviae]|uniref:PTHB1 N-terminal domain-containing protein n=1 Tax=Phytophthora kernoviae TaxID=325452 RepID=A0A421FSM1_9STRA|nr:hypothetical protein BBJ29_002636 [Phytophthora kernoviae]